MVVLGTSQASSSNAGESLDGEIELEYRILLGGFSAGSIRLRAAVTPRDYDLVAWTRSVGALDLVLGFRSRAASFGTLDGGDPTPRRHMAENRWMGEARRVRNDYDPTGRVSNLAIPGAEDDDRDPVPPGRQRGTLDPLSAALKIARAAQGAEPCRQTIAVFDGRRRYDLMLSPAVRSEITGPLFKGPARSCEIALRRIVGFSRNPWLPHATDLETLRLWFAPPAPGLPAIPVRLEADAGLATVRIDIMAARLTAADGGVRFQARVEDWSASFNDESGPEKTSSPGPEPDR